MAGKSNKPGVFVYFVPGADGHGLKISNFFIWRYSAGSSSRDPAGTGWLGRISSPGDTAQGPLRETLRGRNKGSQLWQVKVTNQVSSFISCRVRIAMR